MPLVALRHGGNIGSILQRCGMRRVCGRGGRQHFSRERTVILQIGPESSILVRAAAATILVLHISGGVVGLVSGAAALIARKGGRLHRIAGHAFFVSMLTMSAIGAAVSPFLDKTLDPLVGVFTFYLVATAWATVRRRPGSIGRFEIGAFFLAVGVVVANLVFGVQAAKSPGGEIGGNPPAAYAFLGSLAALAAVLDLRMILRGGVSGRARIARHLWRMCLALGIATASFFLGQQQLFPAALRGSALLFLPEIAVLGLLFFWLVRVRFGASFNARATVNGDRALRTGRAS
jgi:uncharacterized membrane protein